MQKPQVPTYSAEGRRLRAYSVASVERLLALDRVVVRRNRRGEIVACFFRDPDGSSPLRASCNMGQRYSTEAGRCTGRWRLVPFVSELDILDLITDLGGVNARPGEAFEAAEERVRSQALRVADSIVRPLFLKVLRGCLAPYFDPNTVPPASGPLAKPKPKVVAIDSVARRGRRAIALPPGGRRAA